MRVAILDGLSLIENRIQELVFEYDIDEYSPEDIQFDFIETTYRYFSFMGVSNAYESRWIRGRGKILMHK